MLEVYKNENEWFNKLQTKWAEIPQDIAGERVMSSELLKLTDKEINERYDKIVENDRPVREIFEKDLYEKYRGKNILDVGSGMGISSIQFALHGANVTFLDLVEDNLKSREYYQNNKDRVHKLVKIKRIKSRS